MKHLIIGNGEIGKALFKVLERYEPKICDTEGIRGKFNVLHVAFPYSDSFVGSVLSYKGYMLLGKPNVRRPVLEYMEGKIGGHCVINNTFLFDDWLTNTLKERNNEYGG